MTKKDKQKYLIIGAVILIVILMSRKSGNGKTVTVSSDFLIDGYRDMITNDTDLTFEGLPLYVYLARNTGSYAAVKAAYESLYKTNLTFDIINRLDDGRSPAKLPIFVAELYANGGQQLFE